MNKLKEVFNDGIKYFKKEQIICSCTIEEVYYLCVFPTKEQLFNSVAPVLNDYHETLYGITYMVIDIRDMDFNLITKKYVNNDYESEFTTKDNLFLTYLNIPKPIDMADFFDKLTLVEFEALKSIMSIVQDEGDIIISNIINKTKISRPVYTTVLNKLVQGHIISMVNRGTKGIHIKFLTKVDIPEKLYI